MRQLENPRAQRRHDRARLKANRRRYWHQDHAQPGLEKSWAKLTQNPANCSCPMCGNPRRHFGSRTIPEQRLLQENFEAEGWEEHVAAREARQLKCQA